jgi:hypothetical protein
MVLLICRLSSDGAIAQLGERVLCKHEVVGSIPSGSTRVLARWSRLRRLSGSLARPRLDILSM